MPSELKWIADSITSFVFTDKKANTSLLVIDIMLIQSVWSSEGEMEMLEELNSSNHVEKLSKK